MNHLKYRFLFLFIGFNLLAFVTATATIPNPPVKYLGIEQGLSNNAVTCILQDDYGFMWMGTYSGLNRFDGSNFLHYNSIWGDENSIASNHITHLAQNNAHQIWVGTQKGVVYFNYEEAKFSPVYYQTANSRKKIKISSSINGLVAGRKGEMYIATADMGLLVYDPKTQNSFQVVFNHKISNYNVQTIMLDQNDKLWLFIKDIGLCKYNAVSKSITVINSALKNAACLEQDHKNHIWIGTQSGLYKFNTISGVLFQYKSPEFILSAKNIQDLHISKNKLWIATNGGGINILDLETKKLDYILAGESEGLLKSSAVSAIYEDKESRKWIATLRGGVNIIENNLQSFQVIKHDPLNKNSLINNFTLSFCEDENNDLWIGTDGGGLSFYNSKEQKYVNFTADPNEPGSLSSNFVVSILNDHKNQIWVAAFNGGIDLYHKKTRKFKHYNLYNPEKRANENNLWTLYEDTAHRLWAGTTRDGALYLYNSVKDVFELFDKRLTNIHSIFEDRSGTLWIGDYNRLIKVDTQTKKHEFINVHNAIRAMLEDKRGNFWIGTEGGGLLLFNRKNRTFKRFTVANGLPDNSVLTLLEDAMGRIWLSTFNGISMFDPQSNKFKNYVAADGLQSNQFNYNAALKLNSGEFLFGGIKGFNRFNPMDVSNQVHVPELRITGLRINNIGIKNNLEYLKKGSIGAIKEIDVPYNQATLAIDYVALEYSFPEKIAYAYYLEGWDLNWNFVGKATSAYYSRLNPGKYKLFIKATDTDGNWLSPQVIIITVLSPWYLTWWAILTYLVVIATVLYLIRQNRIRQIKLKYEVEKAQLNTEREKELNEKKLSFFTNISHEFRTPLTLIINPIKDLLKTEDQSDRSELNVIYRNARRLLGLVDQLLLFRKTESENDVLNIVEHNFVLLCNDVFMCFSQQAKVKRITYNFICDAPEIIIYSDREKVEVTLFNLLSNAFNFTPEGGKIEVHITEDQQTVFLQISDNGVGIAEDMNGKIFDKFYQDKNNNSLNKGFGIGLFLVKTFIEQHRGTVSYTATAGGGMTFSIQLPKGEMHFKPQQFSSQRIDASSYLSPELPEEQVEEEGTNNLELLISNKQTILIIDDHVELRSYMKSIFKASYAVIQAKDGEEGMLLVKKRLPDIIICDVAMSGINGIDLCKLVKQDTSLSHIPVILLTGDYTPELKLQGIEVGAVDFISKPFDKDLLMARVNGILKIKEELQNYFYSEITLKTDTRKISALHKDFLYQCISIIEASLLDADFDVNKISSEVGMSYSTLLKKIKAITGQSLNRFIRFIRLRKAAELMIHTNCNVNEAAYQVGINDIKYFRAQFFELFGMNPSDFIKKHRKAFQKSYHLNKS